MKKEKKLLFLLIIVCLIIGVKSVSAQTQKGGDIDGEASNDNSGTSVSMPDKFTVAIGATGNDGTNTDAGHVRVYVWNGNAWVQKGADINGESVYDQSGFSVCMPDANTLAVGARYNNGNGISSGHVRIYKWSGSAWVQKGSEIDGEAAGDQSGHSVSMPDSNTLAIGSIYNDGNGTNAGHVRVYTWNGSAWVQKGNDLDGEAANDNFGSSVSMANVNTIAIGARYNSGNGNASGHVRIYRWNGSSWVQKGNDLDGEAVGDLSGHAVSMPDSNTVAIGAPANDENWTKVNSGHVRVYSWNGSAWVQKGYDIDGEADSDASGHSVSMPNANTVAIGAWTNSGNGTSSGHVRVYAWNGNNWIKRGADIDGESGGDQSGCAVSMPDASTLAIGALLNDGNGISSGHVRVYIVCNNTKTIGHTSCAGQYTSPSGKYIWTTSGIYKDTIPNQAGCDSIITVNLTIRNPTYSTITPGNCLSKYTSPSGKYVWTSSGTYYDTIVNAVGCDSVITINLVIKNSSNSVSSSACSSYTSPSGKYVWTSTGIYKDTLPNALGCDSIITINLTIKNTFKFMSLSNCNSYISPSGKYMWTSTGIYRDTIPNTAGCDSIIVINLSILKSTTGSTNFTSCKNFTAPSGKYTWTSSGTYLDTIPNKVGCDSVISITLTINKVDVTVTDSSPLLTANETGAIYQWLNCNNNFSAITNEKGKSFTAIANGSYAVEVSKNGCTDTSICIQVNNLSVTENNFESFITIFPSPTDKEITIDLGAHYSGVTAVLRNAMGQEIDRRFYPLTERIYMELNGMRGIYFVEVSSNGKRAVFKVMKK